MPSSPIAATTRYIAQGVRDFCWLTAIANTSAPTRAEINAGTAIDGELFDAAGFTQNVTFVDAPDFGSKRVQKLPGQITYDDSALTLYLSLTSSDVRTLLTVNSVGFLVIFTEGDVAGRKMDVWPVTIGAQSKPHSLTDPARIVISFGITGTPQENVTVPA